MSGFERIIYLIFLKNYNKKNLQIALKVCEALSGFERFIYLIFCKKLQHKKTFKAIWRFVRHHPDSYVLFIYFFSKITTKKNLQIALKVCEALSGFERFIYLIFLKNHNTKKPSNCFEGLWGIVRIRTLYLSNFSQKSQHKKIFKLH